MKTDVLYDTGEEWWSTKLHLGCGGIFLVDQAGGTGYTNIDIAGLKATKYPELVEQNSANIKDYYRGLDGTLDNIPAPRQTVVDAIHNITDMPYQPSSVDKIVAIQVFEHLSMADARKALLHWWNILKPNGVLILSVPDVPETIQQLKALETFAFAIRHLEGSKKDEYAAHISWYSERNLYELLDEFRFRHIKRLDNFHLYPAIVVHCVKLDSYCSGREYQFPLPGFDSSCTTVLDIGPGGFPLEFATTHFDITDEFKHLQKAPLVIGNAEELPFADKSYSYVYISHCMEHLDNPKKAFDEAVRVGVRGYIEVPSAMLDYEMQHGGTHARWMCLQIPNGIVFVKKTPDLNIAFKDDYVGAFMHRITQYKMQLTHNELDLRHKFWKDQNVLNVSCHWDENTIPKCIVIRADGSIES